MITTRATVNSAKLRARFVRNSYLAKRVGDGLYSAATIGACLSVVAKDILYPIISVTRQELYDDANIAFLNRP